MSENQENGNEFAIDPDVKEELENTLTEEEIIGMYTGQGGKEERIPLIEKFAPEEDQWGGKSYFERGQPRAITLADNLSTAFPVLKPSEKFIEEFIEDYEMRLTSLEGISRDQLMRIFTSMFGGSTAGDEEDPNSVSLMLSAGPDDND